MIAFFSEGVPPAAVYLVSPLFIAAMAASLMNWGVSKSGSPAPIAITSFPSALRRAALAVTASVGAGLMALRRAATSDMDSLRVGKGGAKPHFNLLESSVCLREKRFDGHRQLPRQSLQAPPAVLPRGGPAPGDRQARRGPERRAVVPDAARRDRVRKDLHDGH